MKQKPRKSKVSVESKNRHLRSGSKAIKEILMERNPTCDICGCSHKLQLHHIYLIRHGFATKLEWSALLCANCHRRFHQRWDEYLDVTFQENPDIDFVKIYNVLKKL